jgi:hypothetical protein
MSANPRIPDQPSSPGELLAIEAIRQLKARYCRFVDTKQWERLADVFTPDARLEGFGSVPDGADPTALIAAISKRLADAITIHHVHTPEIVLTGPDRARGIWPMMDYVDFHTGEQGAEMPADRGWIGWGYYEEDYVRSDGDWRISFMRLARQRMDDLTAAHPMAKPGRHKPSVDWL